MSARTWCGVAGVERCYHCRSGHFMHMCTHTPTRPTGISGTMWEVLRCVGPQFGCAPMYSTWPTLQALKRRGLVETRGSKWDGDLEVRRVILEQAR